MSFKDRIQERMIFYPAAVLVVAVATFLVAMLLANIARRVREGREVVLRVVELTEETVDAAEWGKNFPRQYDGYKRTVDTERTRHGGSEAFQKLDADPRMRKLLKGYAFSVDYREERGHAYMLSDQDMTERITKYKQPGSCLHCHAAVIPAYRAAGRAAGVPDSRPEEQVMKGFEKVCPMPYAEARKMVSHPISCGDCHDPDSMQLRVTRPGFINGIAELAKSDEPLPHLESVERWRKRGRRGRYDANRSATRQEMRSFVCAQCHVEYYFEGKNKLLTYPWDRGIRAERAEEHYDAAGFKDWNHADAGSPLLKVQHPEFELWSQGIHARSGVACADCHMPYMRAGAVKISDHHVRSPLLNVNRSCQVCHHFPEEEMLARAERIQDTTKELMSKAEDAVIDLIDDIAAARKSGGPAARVTRAQDHHRKATWRLDYVMAENSLGFHAPQEAARLLGEAIDHARRGQNALR